MGEEYKEILAKENNARNCDILTKSNLDINTKAVLEMEASLNLDMRKGTDPDVKFIYEKLGYHDSNSFFIKKIGENIALGMDVRGQLEKLTMIVLRLRVLRRNEIRTNARQKHRSKLSPT